MKTRYVPWINLLLMLFFCSINLQVNAQKAVIDSLKLLLTEEISDAERSDVLRQLSFLHHQIDVSLCHAYGVESLTIAENLKDTTLMIQAANCIAIAFDMEGNSKKAMKEWEKCLALATQTNQTKSMMAALNNLGITHKGQGNIEKSLHYSLEAIKLHDEAKDTVRTISTHANVGHLYLSMDDKEHAFYYLNRAVEFAQKDFVPDDKKCYAYQRLSEYYVHVKEYKLALPYLNKAFDLCNETSQYIHLSNTLKLLGESRYYLGEKDRGIEALRASEKKLLEIGEKDVDLYQLYYSWATICSLEEEYTEAFDKANKAYGIAIKNNLETFKVASLDLLSKLHKKVGNYEAALNFNIAATKQKDSLYLQSKEALVMELEEEYQSSKKEIENELLRTQQKKTKAELSKKNITMIGIVTVLGLVGLVTVLLFMAYRNKNRYNKELVKQVSERTKDLEESNFRLRNSNIELERFAYIASHDLKTPLNNIINFTNVLESSLHGKNDSQIQQSIFYIKKGGHRMMNLIEDVLEYSRITNNANEEPTTPIDLNELCAEIQEAIDSSISERNGTVVIPERLPLIIGNRFPYFLLFKNLLENAIKYNTSEEPTIKIYTKKSEGIFSIYFEDNGIGMEKEHFDQIFEMFSRLHIHSKYEGTGLGLATCKKIINNIGGEIKVTSKVGEGSIFEIRLADSILYENVKSHSSIENAHQY